MASVQIVNELLVGPTADARGSVGRDVVGAPAVHERSGQLGIAFHGEAQVAGRVALTAMAEGRRQVSAAVLLVRQFRIGAKAVHVEEDKVPKRHGPALIEREDQAVRESRRVNWRKAEQVRLDRDRIVPRQTGIGGVGEGGIEMSAASGYAEMERP